MPEPKNDQKSIKTEMESKIQKWLSSSGYPLELHVSSELMRREYTLSKSELFADVETEKTREIDVTGYYIGDYGDENYYCSRRLIFECKKSEKPILNLCASDERRSIFDHHARHGDPEDLPRPDLLAHINYEKLPGKRKSIGQFSNLAPSGYSLVPAFGKSDQDIYSGLMGLVKASTYHRRLFADFKNEVKNDLTLSPQDRNCFEFHAAAMIIDAPLFDVFLDSDGSTKIEKTDWSIVRVQLPWKLNPHDPGDRYCIHVVTKSGFSNFLNSIDKLVDYVYSPENVDFMLDKRPRITRNTLSKLMRGIAKSINKTP